MSTKASANWVDYSNLSEEEAESLVDSESIANSAKFENEQSVLARLAAVKPSDPNLKVQVGQGGLFKMDSPNLGVFENRFFLFKKSFASLSSQIDLLKTLSDNDKLSLSSVTRPRSDGVSAVIDLEDTFLRMRVHVQCRTEINDSSNNLPDGIKMRTILVSLSHCTLNDHPAFLQSALIKIDVLGSEQAPDRSAIYLKSEYTVQKIPAHIGFMTKQLDETKLKNLSLSVSDQLILAVLESLGHRLSKETTWKHQY